MSEQFAYCYTLLLRVGPAGTPFFWSTVCCRSGLQSLTSGLVWIVMNC